MVKKNHEPAGLIKTVMVSNTITQNEELDDVNEKAFRALMREHFTIRGSDDDSQNFGLIDLEDKIVKAGDAFVFLPIPKEIKQLRAPEAKSLFREMFKASSLFVGAQTKDHHLRLDMHDEQSPIKPIIVINRDGCWNRFQALLEHMHELGTIVQPPSTVIKFVPNVERAVDTLKHAQQIRPPAPSHKDEGHHYSRSDIERRQHDPLDARKPEFNVCVFCSASTKNGELIATAHQLGGLLAAQDWGVISGLGRTGMMGAVVEGAADVIREHKKGWVGGSNLPRLVNMEGMPDYFDRFWCTDDIYRRMDVMVENSQAFIVMPGGMGTVQELMALLLLKHAPQKGLPYRMKDKTFANKPIILVNHELKSGEHAGIQFWKPLVELADKFGFSRDIDVVADIDEAMESLKAHYHRHAT